MGTQDTAIAKKAKTKAKPVAKPTQSLLSQSLKPSKNSSKSKSKKKSKKQREQHLTEDQKSENRQHEKQRLEANSREDEEAKDLEGLLFGVAGGGLMEEVVEEVNRGVRGGMVIDRRGDEPDEPVYHHHSDDEEDVPMKGPSTTIAAWVDEDDAKLTVSTTTSNPRYRRFRTSDSQTQMDGPQLETAMRNTFGDAPDWAALPQDSQTVDPDAPFVYKGEDSDSDSEDEDDVLLARASDPTTLLSTSAPLQTTSSKLPPHDLDIRRVRNANEHAVSQSCVKVVQFHPGNDNLMLTAGLDKTLRFFKVDGKANKKVQGIHFPDLPITSANFLGDSGNVIVTGHRKFFYIYDAVAGKVEKIPQILGTPPGSCNTLQTCVVSPDGKHICITGKDGYLFLLCGRTRQLITNWKMNGENKTVSFTPCGRYVIASGSDGDVYRWDVRSQRCISRFHNQDGTKTSALALSSRVLAIGAESGVVNLYQNNDNQHQQNYDQLPIQGLYNNKNTNDPIKSIMNIKTSINNLKFNTSGEILAMSSCMEMDVLKLVHVSTGSVFANWPTKKTPLGYITSMDFSPCSGFLAVGNDKGKCLLYQLKHYSN